MNQTRPKSSRAVLHGHAPFPGLLPLHGRRRSEHTHTQIKSTNKIYLCAHTIADEDDEGGGRRGWPEVISQRQGCDGDDDECSDKGDDDERSGEGDDEHTARRVSAWNRGEARAGPLAEMTRDGAWRRLEAMGSSGGAVALGRRMKTMDGRRRRGDIY